MEGHLGSLHILAIVNNAAVNIGLHISFQIRAFIFFKYPVVEYWIIWFFFFFLMFIYFWESDWQHVSGVEAERGKERQNPKQAPGSELSAQSPTRGSNSRAVRSWPEWKSSAGPTEPPRCPNSIFNFWGTSILFFTVACAQYGESYFVHWLQRSSCQDYSWYIICSLSLGRSFCTVHTCWSNFSFYTRITSH